MQAIVEGEHDWANAQLPESTPAPYNPKPCTGGPHPAGGGAAGGGAPRSGPRAAIPGAHAGAHRRQPPLPAVGHRRALLPRCMHSCREAVLSTAHQAGAALERERLASTQVVCLRPQFFPILDWVRGQTRAAARPCDIKQTPRDAVDPVPEALVAGRQTSPCLSGMRTRAAWRRCTTRSRRPTRTTWRPGTFTARARWPTTSFTMASRWPVRCLERMPVQLSITLACCAEVAPSTGRSKQSSSCKARQNFHLSVFGRLGGGSRCMA